MGPLLVIRLEDVSVQAIRANGVMALLLDIIDYDKINLLVCWCSNQMTTYLHTSD